ncbi:hypothetical protein ATCC90586_007645 [Pythium insidiosum]|nr:hypothetical protein ATCC90586_007645 [Pythium insidiosum]
MGRSLRCVLVSLSLVVGIALSIAALSRSNWRVASGLEHEIVAPNVTFESLRIGETWTCVTLRWHPSGRANETCYKTFLHDEETKTPTTMASLTTGEPVVLDPVCQADRQWVAQQLGIPDRIRIVDLWDKQCSGLMWIDILSQTFSWVSAGLLAFSLFNAIDDDSYDPCCGPWVSIGVAATAPLFHLVPTIVWLTVMDSPALSVGSSLVLMVIATLIFIAAFAVKLHVVITWRHNVHLHGGSVAKKKGPQDSDVEDEAESSVEY